MGKTSISWTSTVLPNGDTSPGFSFNPWWGCTEISSGCNNCYARVLDGRWGGESHWGKGVPRKTMSDSYWRQPLRWDAIAAKDGIKHKVFCASMADIMDDEAPEGQRDRLWELIHNTPNLIWLLLTKRPQRYAKYLPLFNCPKNIWLGTSAEDQSNYNLRWPYLKFAAEARELISFISYEPALGPLELRQKDGRPNWVICGAESGNNRRDMEQDWANNLRFECENDGVSFWMKQMGARTPEEGSKLIPAHLLIRQFPGETI